MLKGIVSFCIGTALLATSYGAENSHEPKDLTQFIIASGTSTTNRTREGVLVKASKNYVIKGGNLEVVANRYIGKTKSVSESLEYRAVSLDTNTVINLVDNGVNGLSIGDTLNLTHNFPDGRVLKLKAEYPKEYVVRINAGIYMDGKLVSKTSRDTSKTFNIPLIKQLVIDPVFMGPGIEAHLSEGNNIYFQAVSEMTSGQEPKSFPMEEINASFSKLNLKVGKYKGSKIADFSLSFLDDSLSEEFENFANKMKYKEENTQSSEIAKSD